jgi:hypothetical protein
MKNEEEERRKKKEERKEAFKTGGAGEMKTGKREKGRKKKPPGLLRQR